MAPENGHLLIVVPGLWKKERQAEMETQKQRWLEGREGKEAELQRNMEMRTEAGGTARQTDRQWTGRSHTEKADTLVLWILTPVRPDCAPVLGVCEGCS